ncbi:MAG TPA: BadF/BadG/BcrA/BcrD ATPase family protein, partial [Candidatus Limnocylindria bacterium]
MRYAVGVDVGSTQTKAVLVDEKGQIVARSLIDTGAYLVRAAERSLEACLAEANVSRNDVGYAVGTGYGRFKVAFGDDQVTEISCHAKGAWHLFPKTRTVIDIGGQDTKAIKVSDRGEVLD